MTKSEAALAKLDAVEAEMRRIGFWAKDPPDLLADYQAGKRRTYLDAPSFELWLQCVFLPNARSAAREDALPAKSDVGLMAMRQYDYQTRVPEAADLLRLLSEFDDILEGPPETKTQEKIR